MTNTEVVTTIVDLFVQMLDFMVPVIGALAGISFVLTWLTSITMGAGRRTFRG
jgi:hypothetical protein